MATQRKADPKEKTIKMTLYFYTDNLSDKGEDYIREKHAWTRGVVAIESNSSHRISPKRNYPFNSLADIPHCIEKALIDHGIKLHVADRMDKYIVA